MSEHCPTKLFKTAQEENFKCARVDNRGSQYDRQINKPTFSEVCRLNPNM